MKVSNTKVLGTMKCSASLVMFLVFASQQGISCSNIGSTRQDIELSEDGGYTDLLIAIHDNVPEDHSLIENIKVGNSVSVTHGQPCLQKTN